MTTRISELSEPHRGWRYHSGTILYTERLCDGRLIAASLQDTGVPYYANDEEKAMPAFDLQVDGESLAFGWALAEAETAGADTETANVRLLLRHALKPVELEIVTLAAGDGFFRRRMRLRNTSASGSTVPEPLTMTRRL